MRRMLRVVCTSPRGMVGACVNATQAARQAAHTHSTHARPRS